MINKFEAFGISASIAFMVIALFLLRIEAVPIQALNESSDTQVAAIAVANTLHINQQRVQHDTVADAVGKNGELNKLIVNDVLIGSGDAVKKGDVVTVHYIGTLQNGQQFDNSNTRGEPFTFTVGENKVIAGWEQGIIGMQVGGKRILAIPPQLAYGNKAVGPIPPNATLVFAIELLSIN